MLGSPVAYLGNNSSQYSCLTRTLSDAYARKAGFLDRYTISDSGTTVYPTNVEDLAPFPGRCRGVGDDPTPPISARPGREMPVIRHEVIGYNAYPSPVVDFGQDLFKPGIVSGLVKQRESTDSVG